MTDPITLLRDANPVRDCPAPDFERLLERISGGLDARGEHELPQSYRLGAPDEWSDTASARDDEPPPQNGAPRRPRMTVTIAWLVPALVAAAVAVFVVVSLHPARGGAGVKTPTPASAATGGAAGQAHGRIVGSMHVFADGASGRGAQTWGAEWFRTSTGQLCVQAGRFSSAGATASLGTFDSDGRFHAFAPNTAVDAGCVTAPSRGGVALLVAATYADDGAPLTAGGACAIAQHAPCPADQTTTLYFGLLGASAGWAGYGNAMHPRGQTLSPGPDDDGEYLQTAAGGPGSGCATATGSRCHAQPSPAQLVHSGSLAFVVYPGIHHTCVLHGPGVDGVMAGDCPYGFSLSTSPAALTVAEVRTSVTFSTHVPDHPGRHAAVQVTVHLRTRVASSRIGGYHVDVTSPAHGCGAEGGTGSSSFSYGPPFHAGERIRLQGAGTPICAGTYQGSVVVQPLAGSQLTVAHFHFHLTPNQAAR